MLNNKEDKILERIYIKATYQLTSPCIIGSGEDNITDIDITRDAANNPFIPGTSLTGVLRNYLKKVIKNDNNLSNLFGFSNKHERLQSKLFISDVRIEKSEHLTNSIIIRDGVKLNENTKTAMDKSKYDFELIEAGTTFTMKFEVVLRKKDNREALKHCLYILMMGLINEKIRIGAKTNRGYGRGKVLEDSVKILELDFTRSDKVDEYFSLWLNFDWSNITGNYPLESLKSKNMVVETNFSTNTKLTVSLNLPYSLIIRTYNKNPGGTDYSHIKTGKKNVIPGTSWAGGIRHHSKKILDILLPDTKDTTNSEVIKDLFGYLEKETKETKSSRIIIEESTVEDTSELDNTRVKIDRFTGGAVNSALFSATPIYNGTTQLKIEIEEAKEYEIGLLLLVIKDLQQGFLPIGGETSIGRGIFEGEKIQLEYNNKNITVTVEMENKYLKALFDELIKQKEGNK